MLMNYHEMTMGEARDSPARKKQFLVICTVMGSVFIYTLLTSGMLLPMDISEGKFPGGDFVYRYTTRDYAASMSLMESVAEHVPLKPKYYDDVMYNIYLDDPYTVAGFRQRFASGILLNSFSQGVLKELDDKRKEKESDIDKQPARKEIKRLLLEKTKDIVEPTEEEVKEMPAHDLWRRLKYRSQKLPKTKAAVVQFPFTNGFVSALMHSYRVFPALRKFASEHGSPGIVPVVITTCSINESMCTHYAPLEKAGPFRLGHPDADVYLADEGENGMVDWDGVKNMFWKVVTLGKGGESKNEEL